MNLRGFLSKNKNVLWSSDDGRIKITCQGFGWDYGRAVLRINDEDVVTIAYFDDSFDSLSFKTPTDNDGRATEVMELIVKSVYDEDKLSLKTNFNGSDDPFYDNYSTILSKRSLKEDELDARFFDTGWINEEHSMFFPCDSSSILKPNKKGTYDGETVYLWFLEKPRFEIRYEDDVVFASGDYKTNFDSLDLFFDESCGKELFGESMHMLWADAAGYALPALSE